MRSVVPMRVAKLGSIIVSVLMCALGIFLIARPEAFINIFGTFAGAAMIVFGVIKIVGYLSKDLYRLAFQYDLAFGLLMIVVGIFLLFEPSNLMDTICIAVGIAELLDALLKIQISIDARTFGIKQWWAILALALLAAAAGILLIFRPSASARVMVIFMSVSLIADGILNLITMLLTVKIIKNQYPDVIEADFEEID